MHARWSKVLALSLSALMLLPMTALANGSPSTTPSIEQSTPAPRQEAQTGAQLKVAARLQAMLDANLNLGANARANVEAVIKAMVDEMVAEGDAATEAEALVAIETAIEAKGEAAKAMELDLLAQAQLRLGMKERAKATLKSRLQKEFTVKAAYQALIRLEQESGEAMDLDTYVNGVKLQFDVRPQLKESRTMVPIRALVERLGAQVSWEAETQTVTIVKGDQEIKLMIGAKTALVNGVEVQLDAAAQIEGSRTLIPLRFVSEGLGLYVHWLAESRTILVTEAPVQE